MIPVFFLNKLISIKNNWLKKISQAYYAKLEKDILIHAVENVILN